MKADSFRLGISCSVLYASNGLAVHHRFSQNGGLLQTKEFLIPNTRRLAIHSEILEDFLHIHGICLLFREFHPLYGPCQANLILIAYASSEGSGEPAHPRSLARTSAARSFKQWVKRNAQTDFWMAGHAQLKFVMTECSKTQIRLRGLNYNIMRITAWYTIFQFRFTVIRVFYQHFEVIPVYHTYPYQYPASLALGLGAAVAQWLGCCACNQRVPCQIYCFSSPSDETINREVQSPLPSCEWDVKLKTPPSAPWVPPWYTWMTLAHYCMHHHGNIYINNQHRYETKMTPR